MSLSAQKSVNITTKPISKTIGEICTFSNGHGFRPHDWDKEGLPIIRIQNLNGSKKFNYFSGKPEDKWLVETGELLFAWAGTQGVSFGPTIWNGPKGVLNQHIYRVHPNADINKEWLLYALSVVTYHIEQKAHGFKSTLLHVNKKDITSQSIHCPTFEEQNRIVKTLSSWNESIRLLENVIHKKTQLYNGLKQQLLSGKRRLPKFNQPWTKQRLGDHLEESRISGGDGLTAKKITVKLYGNGVFPKVDKRVGSANTKYYVRRAGQFIYSKLDFLNGAFGIIPESLDGYETTLDLPCFDIAETMSIDFLLQLTKQKSFYSRFLSGAAGGRKARRVNPSELLDTQLSLPPLKEQNAITHVMSLMDHELDLLTKKLTALKRQKQSLMQQLLTGKLQTGY